MSELPSDILDIAADLAEQERAWRVSVARQAMQASEKPDEDVSGNRYCLDCADVIPPERVQAVQAVRCVVCAGIREKKAGICRQRGGIRQYLTGDDPVQQGGCYE